MVESWVGDWAELVGGDMDDGVIAARYGAASLLLFYRQTVAEGRLLSVWFAQRHLLTYLLVSMASVT